MATLFSIFLISLAAVVCGAVFLIKLGGWLAILSAILILIYFFSSMSIILILMLAEAAELKKKREETKQ